jgi:hypothetical protein
LLYFSPPGPLGPAAILFPVAQYLNFISSQPPGSRPKNTRDNEAHAKIPIVDFHTSTA